jgi:hypothetical protein
MKELDGDDVLLGKLGCGGDGFEWRCMKFLVEVLWKSCTSLVAFVVGEKLLGNLSNLKLNLTFG